MQSISVYIARHFWRNGEFAVWQANDNFPPGLLAWLKTNYSELVAGSRPQWIDRPEGRVFLFFLDEHEIHGRMATKLTACWLDRLVADPKKTSEQLAEVLQSVHDDQLDGIRVKTNAAQHTKSNFLRFIILVGCVLMVAVGYWFFVIKSNKQSQTIELPVIVDQEKKQEVIKPLIQSETSNLETKKPKSSGVGPCANLPSAIHYCYQLFLSEKCSGKTKNNYDSWLRNLKKKKRSFFVNKSCPENLKHDSDVKNNKNKRALWKYLKQGRK